MPFVKDILEKMKAFAEGPTLGNLHPDARSQAIIRAGLAQASVIERRSQMTRCTFCGESVKAAPADEKTGVETLNACASALTTLGSEHQKTMLMIAGELRIMLASRTELTDDQGNVTGYTIKTGALHRILGYMSGAGYPVVIPTYAPDDRGVSSYEAKGNSETVRTSNDLPTAPE